MINKTLYEAMERHHRGEYGKTDWERLETMTDKEIEEAVRNDPDAAPITDSDFWQDAKVVTPKHKRLISLHVDADILEWFQSQGSGYQTQMNSALRNFMEAQRKSG